MDQKPSLRIERRPLTVEAGRATELSDWWLGRRLGAQPVEDFLPRARGIESSAVSLDTRDIEIAVAVLFLDEASELGGDLYPAFFVDFDSETAIQHRGLPTQAIHFRPL